MCLFKSSKVRDLGWFKMVQPTEKEKNKDGPPNSFLGTSHGMVL
jgi:hypothetical protein